MQPIHELDLLEAILSSTHQGLAPDYLKGSLRDIRKWIQAI